MENEMTNDAAVAWEERHRGPDGEWRAWTPCSKAYFDGYATSNNYETRALVPATTVAELRARVAELEANDRRYRFLRDGDGEVFWQDAYEAIGSAFVGSHIDSLIDEAMDRFKADQEDDSP